MAEGVQVSAQSLADLKKLGEAYKAGDKALQKRVRTALQSAAKPLAADMIRAGAEKMPRRGGLAARIAASRGGVTVSLRGKTTSVSIRLSNRQKDSLRGLDAGTVRHPVYGRGTWVSQRVPAHAFTHEFEAKKSEAVRAVNKAVQQALTDVARKA